MCDLSLLGILEQWALISQPGTEFRSGTAVRTEAGDNQLELDMTSDLQGQSSDVLPPITWESQSK